MILFSLRRKKDGHDSDSGIFYHTFYSDFLYYCIEIIARGYSHFSMLLAGGTCFLLVGLIEYLLGDSASLLSQMILCGLMITFVELLFGLVVNRQMHLNVWDYSSQPYNFHGQICLLYSNLWFLLSCPVILFHDLMESVLMGNALPRYHIF